jgi:hypothetical protein
LTRQPDEIRHPSRLNWATAFVAAVGIFVLILALVLVFLLTSSNRPGDRVRLLGSTWTVTEIDGAPANGGITVTFDDGATFGRFSSDCSTIGFEWSTDTDGAAFSISERTFEETGCSTDAKARDTSLGAILSDVDEWQAPASNRIEFLRRDGVTVFAAQRGDVK